MKAILISIKPKWVEKILNGEKTIEVRKRFPKDYVGWVYIYCTKDNKNKLYKSPFNNKYCLGDDKYLIGLNGKVVARFYCDNVDNINVVFEKYCAGGLSQDGLLDCSCLSFDELHDYLNGYSDAREIGKAIHISQLEIFDKPKELSDFKKCQLLWSCLPHDCINCRHLLSLTKAPQSWCYVEGGE